MSRQVKVNSRDWIQCVASRYLIHNHADYLEDGMTKGSKLNEVLENWEKEVQEWFGQCEDVLRLYGSAAELVRNMRIFSDFPSNVQFFTGFSNKCPPSVRGIIRVFEDGCDKFVIVQELKNAMDYYGDDEVWKVKEFCSTYPYEHVQEQFGKLLKKIKFVPTPIKRAKHRAVPVATPHGTYCILAADAFFELMRDVIFGINFFQSFCYRDLNNTLRRFFGLLNPHFESIIKSKYFISLKKHEDFRTKLMEEFEPEFDLGEISNYKDGFTLSDLRKELEQFDFDKLEIKDDYITQSFEYVEKNKKGSKLRTCDMFSAIEQCLLPVTLNLYPRLASFLHSQNACKRLAVNVCKLCRPEVIDTPMFQDSKWKEIKSCETVPTKDWIDGKKATVLRTQGTTQLPNGQVFVPNYFFTTGQPCPRGNAKTKVYILDNRDTNNLKSIKLPSEGEFYVPSLESYTKVSPGKKLYLRTFFVNRQQLVFAVEVIEVVKIGVRRQKKRLNSFENILRKYEKKWTTTDTITLQELNEVLKELDFDKSLFTLIPDISVLDKDRWFSHGRLDTIILGPTQKKMMSVEQFIFNIFKRLVCSRHPKNFQDIRNNVINNMEKYLARYKPGQLIEYPEGMKEKNGDCELFKLFFNCDFNDRITIAYFLELCAEYEVNPPYHKTSCNFDKKELEKAAMCVWKAQVIFLLTWSKMFFDKGTEHLKKIVDEQIKTLIPLDHLESEIDIMKIILNLDVEKTEKISNVSIQNMFSFDLFEFMEIPIEEEPIPGIIRSPKWFHARIAKVLMMKGFAEDSFPVEDRLHTGKREISIEMRELTKKYQVMESCAVTILEKILNKEDFEKKEEKNTPECSPLPTKQEKVQKVVNVKENQEDPTVTHPPNSSTSNESSCCPKCLRTSELCNEVKKKLSTTQNKLEVAEKVAANQVKRENRIKEEMEKEFKKKMEIMEAKQKKSDEKMKKLEEILTQKTENEKALKEKNKKLLEENETLKKQLGNNQKTLNCLQSKVPEFEGKYKEAQEEMENTKALNKRLQQANDNQIMEIHEQQSIIQSLIKYAQNPGSSGSSLEMREHLAELEEKRKAIHKKLPHEKDLNRIQRLMNISRDTEDITIVNKEKMRITKEFKKYQERLNLTIQMIQLYPRIDFNDLPVIPELPTLSEEFLIENKRILKKNGELEDWTCQICYEEMLKLEGTVKCSCKRRFHNECAERWRTVPGRSCPNCQRAPWHPIG